jgi:hypothetical protein
MFETLQARYTVALLTRLVARLYMGQGGVEDPYRRGTCQEISGDLTSRRDTPGQFLTNGKGRSMFLTNALLLGMA